MVRGSPAVHAGIQRGDVIASVDGAATDTASQLRNLIALAGKGKPVQLVVERGGQRRTSTSRSAMSCRIPLATAATRE